MPVATHGQGGRADRAAEIEGENLCAVVAAELQGHQRQQHGFAGAGWADDERVADVADMERETERGGAFGLGEEQRRGVKMFVALRAGPDGGERDHVGQVQGRDRRLAHIGVGMAGQRAEPGFQRVHPFHHAGEVAALDDFLDQTELFVGDAGVLIPDGDGGGNIGLADGVGAEFLERQVGIGGLVGGVGVQQ